MNRQTDVYHYIANATDARRAGSGSMGCSLTFTPPIL